MAPAAISPRYPILSDFHSSQLRPVERYITRTMADEEFCRLYAVDLLTLRGEIALDVMGICSHFVLITRTMTTLGQAARHGMLVWVMCRKCGKVGFFIASDLANVNGQGRSFESLKFRCKECEVVPFEDDRDRVNKKRIVWRPVRM